MYRTPPPGVPTTDPTMLIPGRGFGGAVLGGSTPRHVLTLFGNDARVLAHPDGDIYQIRYRYVDGYADDRPANETRPVEFHFRHGLLGTIEVTGSQRELYTLGGIRSGTQVDHVRAVFGPPSHVIEHDEFETWRYVHAGFECGVFDGRVGHMRVFRARGAPPPAPVADPRYLGGGAPFRGCMLGHSTPAEVALLLGDDCQVHPPGRGADVTQLDYKYTPRKYDPDRDANRQRPEVMSFEHGLLDSIEVGVYQSELHTDGGIAIRSSRAAVIATFGPDFERYETAHAEVLRYLARGVELSISRDDAFGVASWDVFRPQSFEPWVPALVA